MEVKFMNKTKGAVFFSLELGLTGTMGMYRLQPGKEKSFEVEQENRWCEYEKVTFKMIRNNDDELVQVLDLKRRKKAELVALVEPVLQVNYEWDMRKERGNSPSSCCSYMINEEERINLMLNVPITVAIPKDSFVAPYRKLKLVCEVKPFSDTFFTEFRCTNKFHLSLKERRPDSELRKIGLIRTVEKKTFRV